MRKPYRVIVWGPGAVGQACMKCMEGRPEFELVGVLAHNPEKDGADVGELLGHAPSGVKITTDKDAIFAMDADCVLYTGMPRLDPDGMDGDTIRLLESGKSVISSAAYFYPPYQGADHAQRLEAACKKGGASLHGTGTLPGFFFARLGLTLTGMCTEVEYLKMEEFVNIGRTSLEQMAVFGIGLPLETAQQPNPLMEGVLKTVFGEELSMVSEALYGRSAEIGMETAYRLADEDLVLEGGTIEKGLVNGLSHTYTARIDGEPRLVTTINWMVTGDNEWRMDLEGKPVSFHLDLAAFASVEQRLAFHPGDPTGTTQYVTAMPMIQAIPVVCDGEPGLVYPSIFANATPDLRTLATRTSIVG
jgi:hypothetical protein